MTTSKTKGRMLNQDISDSKGFGSLSPKAAVLFCMIIPHLNSHGKMNGGTGYIKDKVCPRISYLNTKDIEKAVKEISNKTNTKWFIYDGRYWIHNVNFLKNHQKLKDDRLGLDLLPSYSGVGQEFVPLEVEVEVEVEVEDKGDSASFFDTEKSFKEIWNKYPKKDGRKDALRHFRATVKTEEDNQRINQALTNYLNCKKVRAGYIKDGSTWFNNWEDWFSYVEPESKQTSFKPKRNKTLEEFDELKKQKEVANA